MLALGIIAQWEYCHLRLCGERPRLQPFGHTLRLRRQLQWRRQCSQGQEALARYPAPTTCTLQI